MKTAIFEGSAWKLGKTQDFNLINEGLFLVRKEKCR